MIFVIEMITGSVSDKGIHSTFWADSGNAAFIADPILNVSGIHAVTTKKTAATLAVKYLYVIGHRMGEYLIEFLLLIHKKSIA